MDRFVAPGDRFLLRFRSRAESTVERAPHPETTTTLFRGEIIFDVGRSRASVAEIRIRRLGILSLPSIGRSSIVGNISFQGTEGRGSIRLDDQGRPAIELDFRATSLNDVLEGQTRFRALDGHTDVFVPEDPERFTGRLSVRLQPRRGPGPPRLRVDGSPERRPERFTARGALDLTYREGGLGWTKNLRFTLGSRKTASLVRLRSDQPPCCVLHLRPVSFRTGPHDPAPTASQFDRLVKAANDIWRLCNLRFRRLAPHVIDDPDYKVLDNSNLVRTRWTDALPYGIEVFFVDAGLVGEGGGATYGAGSAHAKVVLTDNLEDNDTLLAHELGHVLGLAHPSGAGDGFCRSTSDSVMESTGSAEIPNPATNSQQNCDCIANAALFTLHRPC